jgi:glycosyltransferase involved in cell wall biosynthesis
MLSILIPVFNNNVVELVKTLIEQGLKLEVPFEIIVLDDGSDPHYVSENRITDSWENVRYISMEKNLGRSVVRNKLASLAKTDYLLFVDGDARVINKNFLKEYVKHCSGKIVICGGTVYEQKPPANHELFLRWKYGIIRESRTAHERNKDPNIGFSSFNFLIEYNLFHSLKFSENLDQYGHEDTLFGYELKKMNVSVKHIDNPLLHTGLEPNHVFIKKTLDGVRNLNQLTKQMQEPADFIQQISLLRMFYKLKKLHLFPLHASLNKRLMKLIERNLYTAKPCLYFFDLYKLLYFNSLYASD